eukprot:s1200_g1.t1
MNYYKIYGRASSFWKKNKLINFPPVLIVFDFSIFLRRKYASVLPTYGSSETSTTAPVQQPKAGRCRIGWNEVMSAVIVQASWPHPSASTRGQKIYPRCPSDCIKPSKASSSAPRSRLCGMAQHAASAVALSAAAAAAAAIAATVLCTLALAAAPTAVAALAWCWRHRDHKGRCSARGD